jgi:hypothetical protein
MNGFGFFLWKDGRYYKGEYKEDKKHNFGIYVGHHGKKYEGLWEDGTQKSLGKYTKNDGSSRIGYWNENILMTAVTDEYEIAEKLAYIDDMTEETVSKVNSVLESMYEKFQEYVPGVDYKDFLTF